MNQKAFVPKKKKKMMQNLPDNFSHCWSNTMCAVKAVSWWEKSIHFTSGKCGSVLIVWNRYSLVLCGVQQNAYNPNWDKKNGIRILMVSSNITSLYIYFYVSLDFSSNHRRHIILLRFVARCFWERTDFQTIPFCIFFKCLHIRLENHRLLF